VTRRQQPVFDCNRLSPDDIHAAHAQIAEAIIARDGALARHRMMTHLEEVSATGPRRPRARCAAKRTRPRAARSCARNPPHPS
jgi:DNA-binding FadR family transcriptional regulator